MRARPCQLSCSFPLTQISRGCRKGKGRLWVGAPSVDCVSPATGDRLELGLGSSQKACLGVRPSWGLAASARISYAFPISLCKHSRPCANLSGKETRQAYHVRAISTLRVRLVQVGGWYEARYLSAGIRRSRSGLSCFFFLLPSPSLFLLTRTLAKVSHTNKVGW